jgi:hypothetical protein
LKGTTDLESAESRGVDVVIEAVPEKLELKRAIFHARFGVRGDEAARDQHVVALDHAIAEVCKRIPNASSACTSSIRCTS